MKKKKSNYCLRLYITGNRPQSVQAIRAVKAACEKYLKGDYALEVVDLYQQPEQAKEAQVIAAPTLIKSRPAPIRRLVGDMSKEDRLLAGLGVPMACA